MMALARVGVGFWASPAIARDPLADSIPRTSFVTAGNSYMALLFTDLFRQCQAFGFGIPEDSAAHTVGKPDASHILDFNGRQIGLFLRREVSPAGEHFILLTAQRDAGDWAVSLTFPLLPSLVGDVGQLDPLIVLQYFVQRSGLTICIADQLNKFIMNQAINVPAQDAQRCPLLPLIARHIPPPALPIEYKKA
jgi:hypothetical protein